MSKTLVLGDIHGRLIWKDIIKEEEPDKVIFLGDYVSTHEGISPEQQLSNLEDILNYKEENSDKVILLRGNHDLCELDYYWAGCSGHNPLVSKGMKDMKDRFLSNSQWLYIEGSVVFSHAGVSQTWLHHCGLTLEKVNDEEPSEHFGFIPDNMFDFCGESETQPPVWIRPSALVKCNITGYDQVVGHTPVRDITYTYKDTKGKQRIWFCDNLVRGQYLIIDNNEFIPKYYESKS